MTESYNEIINSLKRKLSELFSLYEKTKEEIEIVKKEKDELLRKIIVLEKELMEKNKKYENIKLAKTILTESGDSHEAKIKINRIVREINKCIALLNK